jgi:diguanylate cyclase
MRISATSWHASFDPKTKIRLRSTLYGAADYLANTAILFGFAAAGTIPYRLPMLVLGLAIPANALFLIAIASGFTRRFRDPSLTVLQIFTSCAINFMGLLMAPGIAYVFIINLFVTLSFGSLYFNRRTYVHAWLLLSIALAAAMPSLGEVPNLTIATPVERLLFWASVCAALARFLAINAGVSQLRARLARKNDELAAATARLADLASRDELTGLWNQREFMLLLQDESRRAVRNRTGFCVALIDIDHFRQINDRLGAEKGDAILHEMAQLLDLVRRGTDSVARYGGERFALLAVNAKLSTVTIALERIRREIAQHDWTVIASDLQLTVSAGIAEWSPGETLNQVLGRAEAMLREAKDMGRGGVRAALR